MRPANLNQMIFYVQYEHMMGFDSGLIGFLQILKGRRKSLDLSVQELARAALPIRGHAKDISPRRSPSILALASVRTTVTI